MQLPYEIARLRTLKKVYWWKLYLSVAIIKIDLIVSGKKDNLKAPWLNLVVSRKLLGVGIAAGYICG